MKHIPLEDFFRNSPQTAFQLSPDGQHIAYLAPYHDRMNIFVRPCNIGSSMQANVNEVPATQLTSETERSIAGYFWANNQRILFMRDTAGDENYQLYGVNLDGSDPQAYTAFTGVRTTIIDDLEEVEDEIIIGMNQRNAEVFDPYRLNLRTGTLRQLAENPGNWQGWMTDHDGVLRSVTAIVDGVNTQLLYRDNDQEPFRPVLTTNFRESVDFLEFTPDNKLVWAATNLGRDKSALVLMNPSTCQELEVLYEHPRYDITSISYSRRRKRLLGVFCTGHKETVRHYFDEEEASLRKRLEEHFPGRQFGMADMDKAEENYLIFVGGDRTRGAYYFYNIHENSPHLIAELAPWLHEEDLVPMQPITYPTRDGLEIEAYLSRPHLTTSSATTSAENVQVSHASAEQVPLVVLPHGGPWARDRWGYHSEVQFLCNRGYAVLQMNFRGSTGYGRRFLEASYKEWGRKMQDDITDGVQFLIEQGIADPARIAIYGGSYGGYATLAGLCFTPDLYCCGVDYCGVSNLFTFMQTIPPYWKPMLDMMHEQVGDPEQDHDLLAAVSPALHADCIRVPLFIAQGANDPRVNKAESDQMVAALRERGVEVEYMVKDDEGHGFANQENRFDFYRVMETFLAKHL